jgi:hypothetical protein
LAANGLVLLDSGGIGLAVNAESLGLRAGVDTGLTTNGADNMADAKALRDAEKFIRDTLGELARKKKTNDQSGAEELADKLATALEYVEDAEQPGGRPRRLGDRAKTNAHSVNKAVRDAVKELQTIMPALADQLEHDVIRDGGCVTYSPPTPIDWRLD